ncbi:MAG: NB-ARC domain-containing protein [Geitlerinemataceae cyanobacterium]
MSDERKIETSGGDYREVNTNDRGQYAERDVRNDRNQQGIIANDNATINIDKAELNFAPKLAERTGTMPPNNLQSRGILESGQFVGREDALRELHELLNQSSQVAISSAKVAGVTGMGGVGKSELAVQYARQHLAETYRGGVVWLAADRAGLELVGFAKSSFFPTIDFAQLGDLPEQLNYCWQHWPAEKVPPESVLLIFDDVTDYRSQVVPCLPSDSRFRVMLTTRERLQGISRLDLDVLSPKAAWVMLQNIISEERMAAESETAAALCEFLGFLPLGIELAGYYVCEEECSLAELLAELEARKREVLKHEALKYPEPTMTAQYGVEAALDLSWERLDLDARFLGSYLGLFAAAPIRWNLVVKPEEVTETVYEALRVARRKLIRLSLLKKVGEFFQYHPLVKQFFLSKLESDEFVIPPEHQLTEGSSGLMNLLGMSGHS